jgi:hypothetical protein
VADVAEAAPAASPTTAKPYTAHPSFAHWQSFPTPGKRTAPFVPVWVDGVHGLQVQAQNGSVSILQHQWQADTPQVDAPNAELTFSWHIDRLLPDADLKQKHLSDSPVRMGVAFDGDRSKWNASTTMLSELSRLMTGQELPYASLMYVWSNQYPVDTILQNPRTDRIRYWVLQSGTADVGRWVHHRRNVRADFEKAFAEPAAPVVGLLIMTDTDNTQQPVNAVYGPVLWLGKTE